MQYRWNNNFPGIGQTQSQLTFRLFLVDLNRVFKMILYTSPALTGNPASAFLRFPGIAEDEPDVAGGCLVLSFTEFGFCRQLLAGEENNVHICPLRKHRDIIDFTREQNRVIVILL